MNGRTRKRRRRGLRLDNRVVDGLPFKRKQYTVWDLTTEGCGVRVSGASKACVISVRIGEGRKFRTVGTITLDSPYEYLREQALQTIGGMKRARLPKVIAPGESTLREVMEDYFTAHPKLRARTKADYRRRLGKDFELYMDQPLVAVTNDVVMQLNRERIQALSKADPGHTPPYGFYGWQAALRCLRALVGWYAAQKNRINPWPNRRALPIQAAPPRRLPIELRTAAGRRKLIEGLKADNSAGAKAARFLCFTGFRRREGTELVPEDLHGSVLEFRSKTRTLRVPLCQQALALIDRQSATTLVRATEWQLRQPLIRIFGERRNMRGRKRACVTPHDLRRLFKTVGTEIGIDPTILNLLVGHALKGVDPSYIENIRLGVLRAAVQKIADEIENPKDMPGEDELLIEADRPSELPGESCALVPAHSAVQPLRKASDFLGAMELPAARSVKAKRPPRLCQYIAREELYTLVWTCPVREAALRFGLTDVGLAKICRRAYIPVPPRGYWAKIESGLHLAPAPLPAAPGGMPPMIRIPGRVIIAVEPSETPSLHKDEGIELRISVEREAEPILLEHAI